MEKLTKTGQIIYTIVNYGAVIFGIITIIACIEQKLLDTTYLFISILFWICTYLSAQFEAITWCNFWEVLTFKYWRKNED